MLRAGITNDKRPTPRLTTRDVTPPGPRLGNRCLLINSPNPVGGAGREPFCGLGTRPGDHPRPAQLLLRARWLRGGLRREELRVLLLQHAETFGPELAQGRRGRTKQRVAV